MPDTILTLLSALEAAIRTENLSLREGALDEALRSSESRRHHVDELEKVLARPIEITSDMKATLLRLKQVNEENAQLLQAILAGQRMARDLKLDGSRTLGYAADGHRISSVQEVVPRRL